MNRRQFLERAGVSVSAGVAVAGCSGQDGADATTADPGEATTEPTPTPTPGPQPEFSSSVTWPIAGVGGQPMAVTVDVENTGEGAGEFEATLALSGEEVDRAAVSVDPGETATVTLSHTPASGGIVEVSVAGETETLTVHDNELTFVHKRMNAVETIRVEKDVAERGEIDHGQGAMTWEEDASETIEKNFAAETQYRQIEADVTEGDAAYEVTTDQWVVDGVEYERLRNHTDDTTEYAKRPNDAPHQGTVLDVHGTTTESFLSFEHTDDEYVFVFDPGTVDGAKALADRMVGVGGEKPAEQATDAFLELRYDRTTGRATTAESELTLDGAETYPHLEQTVSRDYVAYGESVDVEVPEEVETNAT